MASKANLWETQSRPHAPGPETRTVAVSSRPGSPPRLRALPRVRPRHRWYLPLKFIGEWCAALVLSVFAWPVILVLALLVKLTSRGPAFYTQVRLGKDGRPFTIYKLRTMIHKCESLTGPRWAIPDDPRVTPIGHFLRKAHLDELPQLLNVLRGEMALIGPRPERPEFFPELERALPRYRQRLAVRPGVTGLAQVLNPADTDLQSVHRKLGFDLFYVEWVSPWLDLRILISTLFYAVGIPSEAYRRFLAVPEAATLMAAAAPLVGAARGRPWS